MNRSLFLYIACAATMPSLLISCTKGKVDYTPLHDTCLMQNNAAFRKGKWKLIMVNSVDLKENRFINFVTDSLYIEERSFSRFDTAEFSFPECNWMVIRQYVPGEPTPREFGNEVHYSPQDSLFLLIKYNQLGDKYVYTYKKL